MPDAAPPRLKVDGLEVGYGRTPILRGADFEIAPGEIVVLLGANGSGKSTALNAVSGFVRPSAGTIALDGEDVTGAPTHVAFARGIVQVSQARDLFPELSVHENIDLGTATLRGVTDRAARLEEAYALFPKLAAKRRDAAQTLSGGEQQMVAMARALVSRPRLILLDEPSGGLAPRVVGEIAALLVRLKQQGVTMLLVEQNIFLATAVADRYYILRDGLIRAEDRLTRETMSQEEIVRSVYL